MRGWERTVTTGKPLELVMVIGCASPRGPGRSRRSRPQRWRDRGRPLRTCTSPDRGRPCQQTPLSGDTRGRPSPSSPSRQPRSGSNAECRTQSLRRCTDNRGRAPRPHESRRRSARRSAAAARRGLRGDPWQQGARAAAGTVAIVATTTPPTIWRALEARRAGRLGVAHGGGHRKSGALAPTVVLIFFFSMPPWFVAP
jgi:hypothetical protein